MYVRPRKTEVCVEKAWNRCSDVAGIKRRAPNTSLGWGGLGEGGCEWGVVGSACGMVGST